MMMATPTPGRRPGEAPPAGNPRDKPAGSLFDDRPPGRDGLFRNDPFLRIPNWLIFAMMAAIIGLIIARQQAGPGAGTSAEALLEPYARSVMDVVIRQVSTNAVWPTDAASTDGSVGSDANQLMPIVQPPSPEEVEAAADESFGLVFGRLGDAGPDRSNFRFSINPDATAWQQFIAWMEADPDATAGSATDAARIQSTPLLAMHVDTRSDDAPTETAGDDRIEVTALVTGLGQVRWALQDVALPDWADR